MAIGATPFSALIIRHEIPRLRYEAAGNAPESIADSTVGARQLVDGYDVDERGVPREGGAYELRVPGESVPDESLAALTAWASVATWDDFSIQIPWAVGSPGRMGPSPGHARCAVLRRRPFIGRGSRDAG